MPVDIRPARDAEMGAFAKVARRSLTLPASVAPPEATDAIAPEWTLCAFENGELATSYAWWPLTMRFSGNPCPVAGITFVGTNSIHRRKGHLRRIITRHFEIMHEQGHQSVAALHASRTAIYQRYGYAVVSWRNAYKIDPRDLVFALGSQGSENKGQLREIDEEQRDVLKDVYRQFCRHRTGYLHRSRGIWDTGVLALPPKDGALFQIVYEQDRKPLGYVIYTIQPAKGDHGRLCQKVVIRDFAWLTPGAHQSLWRHLAGMDLADHIQWTSVPADDPLLYFVTEPAALHVKTRDGFMARIVDAAGALARRVYSADGRICFALEDDLCPWNRGTWQMEVSDGRATVTPARRKPEIRLSIDVLAMLVFGHIPADRAAHMGLIQVLSAGALPLWRRMLQTPFLPFCPDFF